MCLCLDVSKSGLFRVSGSVKRCQDLRKSFDQGGFLRFGSGYISTLASLLKLFLRELPIGLVQDLHRTQLMKVFGGYAGVVISNSLFYLFIFHIQKREKYIWQHGIS